MTIIRTKSSQHETVCAPSTLPFSRVQAIEECSRVCRRG